jgi:hypothetical protein
MKAKTVAIKICVFIVFTTKSYDIAAVITRRYILNNTFFIFTKSKILPNFSAKILIYDNFCFRHILAKMFGF